MNKWKEYAVANPGFPRGDAKPGVRGKPNFPQKMHENEDIFGLLDPPMDVLVSASGGGISPREVTFSVS